MLKFDEDHSASEKINVDNKVRFRYLDARRSRSFELPFIGLRLNPMANSHFCIIPSEKASIINSIDMRS
jgi:hypothetical protein